MITKIEIYFTDENDNYYLADTVEKVDLINKDFALDYQHFINHEAICKNDNNTVEFIHKTFKTIYTFE